MTEEEKLEAIGHIISSIKNYRFETGYSGDMFESSALDAYLKCYLSAADFAFWRSLYLDPNTRYLFN